MRILSCIQDNLLGGKMMRWKKIVLFSITFASILVCSCENITKGLFNGVILPTAETISIGGGGI